MREDPRQLILPLDVPASYFRAPLQTQTYFRFVSEEVERVFHDTLAQPHRHRSAD